MVLKCVIIILSTIIVLPICCSLNKEEFRLKSKEMFLHAFESYMNHAYPADELMPLSCKGRYRGVEKSRGDIDDILGNFSLTLIDSLDTLYIMNELALFENSVKIVIDQIKFDANITVSVFEVNIRIVGGLIGAHIAADNLKKHGPIRNPTNLSETVHYMKWYQDELLWMAEDVAKRLLPAFNTPTGIPYPRINLKYGYTSVSPDVSTCTACAGTIILEFAALSRLTDNPIYEEKATKALNYIWEQRNRFTNLVGTIINIYDGNWMRRESGVGAGIDSYYEYLLKAYVLLGDETYLHRFRIHYDAIQRYINTDSFSSLPLLLDVNMHQPLQRVKNFMDSLLAFWPGLQVLFGDIKQAVAIHEVLSQVMKRHSFLPEAFTTDFHVYWGHHLLRPEFLESNYFLYHSTGDSYYLDIGAQVLRNLELHARVKCGFAAIKDVRTMNHSDQMDSFVLAETFKYLYLLFAEPHHLPINLDDYIFTTEGHILRLNLGLATLKQKRSMPIIHNITMRSELLKDTEKLRKSDSNEQGNMYKSCKNYMLNADATSILKWVFLRSHAKVNDPIYRSAGQHLAASIREPLRDVVLRGGAYQTSTNSENTSGPVKMPLLPKNLLPNNPDHVNVLRRMGIQIHSMPDGRIQLYHQPNLAESESWSMIGETFMSEMMKISHNQATLTSLFVNVIVNESSLVTTYRAAPAQFGHTVVSNDSHLGILGHLKLVEPFNGCKTITNDIRNYIAVAKRGDCMFIDKARNVEKAGGIGLLIIDNVLDSQFDRSALFSMSGDGKNDVTIPVLFIFHKEGQEVMQMFNESGQNNLTLLFTAETYSNVKIGQYITNLKKKNEAEMETTFSKAIDREAKELSQMSHSRIDMHFIRLSLNKNGQFADSQFKSIYDLERIQLYRMLMENQDYKDLFQYRLRIYPNDAVSAMYKHIDRDPNIFADAMEKYILQYSNLEELRVKDKFLAILKWALTYDNELNRISLDIDTDMAVDIMDQVAQNLGSQGFSDRSELAMPTAKAHAISFDIIIYLKTNLQHNYNDGGESEEENKSYGDSASDVASSSSDNDNTVTKSPKSHNAADSIIHSEN